MEFVVVSYHLGGPSYASQSGLPELIRQLRPDLLCLQAAALELHPNPSHAMDLMTAGGFTTPVANTPRRGGQIVSLSRSKPTYRRLYFNGWHYGAVEVRLALGKTELTVVNVHCHPSNEDLRLHEINDLLSRLDQTGPVIISGCFNALAAGDMTRDLGYRLQSSNITLLGEPIRFDAMDQLREAGFRPLGSIYDRSVPTPSSADPAFTVPVRIDYALANPAARALVDGCWTIENPLTDELSSHYPVAVRLEI